MGQFRWIRFEWDDENKKNGNVQHLRDRGIEPNEAEQCFLGDFTFARDDSSSAVKRKSKATEKSRAA